MDRLLSPFSKQGFSLLIPSALLANRAANLESQREKKNRKKGMKYIAGSGWPRPHRYSRAQMKTRAQAFYSSMGFKKEKKKKTGFGLGRRLIAAPHTVCLPGLVQLPHKINLCFHVQTWKFKLWKCCAGLMRFIIHKSKQIPPKTTAHFWS